MNNVRLAVVYFFISILISCGGSVNSDKSEPGLLVPSPDPSLLPTVLPSSPPTYPPTPSPALTPVFPNSPSPTPTLMATPIVTPSPNIVPDAFSFAIERDVPIDFDVFSETLTMSGLSQAGMVTVSGGAFSIDNGPYASEPRWIKNDQTLTIRLRSPKTYRASISARVSVGNYSTSFVVETSSQADLLVDHLDVSPKRNVPLNSDIVSDEIRISGISEPLSIRVSKNARYSINNNEFVDTAQNTVKNGDTVRIKLISSDAFASSVDASLHVGDVSTTFHVTTAQAFIFPGDNGSTGTELWVTDGSTKGTRLLEDIGTGSKGSNPSQLTRYKDNLYFLADDGKHGNELHELNLNSSELSLVKNIDPDGSVSLGARGLAAKNKAIHIVNDKMLFIANGRLWASDGSEEGTIGLRLDTLPIFFDGLFCCLRSKEISVLGDLAYVIMWDELWLSDGTQQGTRRIFKFPSLPDRMSIQQSVVMGNALYFLLQFSNDLELWKTDGSENGTHLVKKFSGKEGQSAKLVTNDTQILIILPNGKRGVELWRSDGSENGTELVRDFSTEETRVSISIDDFVTSGSISYFVLTVHFKNYVWRTDGTVDGTIRIPPGNNVLANEDPYYIGLKALTMVDDRLFFRSYASSLGQELWSIDQNQEHASILKDIYKGVQSSNPRAMTAFNGELVFSANDENGTGDIWVSDGTETGTKKLIEGSVVGSTQADNFFLTPEKIYFSGDIDDLGDELYEYDKVDGSTRLLSDINMSSRNGVIDGYTTPFNFIEFKGEKYFFANRNMELRRLEGAASKSILVYGLEYKLSRRFRPVATDKFIFFAVRGKGAIDELWVSDGTSGGTYTLQSINFGRIDSSFSHNGKVYFVGHDRSAGRELWVSDGTAEGTIRIKDIRPGRIGALSYRLFSSSTEVIAARGRIYFLADDGVSGEEIWTTDGTENGTYRVSDFTPGADSSRIQLISVEGDSLVFMATVSDQGTLLIKMNLKNGEPTVIKKGVELCGEEVEIDNVYASDIMLGEKIVFTFKCGFGKAAIWVTNGTASGTHALGVVNTYDDTLELAKTNGNIVWLDASAREIVRANDATQQRFNIVDNQSKWVGTYPDNLRVVNDVIYFSAVTEHTGRELWRSDLTQEGTHLVVDLNEGTESGVNAH